MGTHTPPFTDFQLNILQIVLSGLFLFIIGYWVGNLKSKKLARKMSRMEKTIMDLNTELLYGHKTQAH